MKRLLSVALAAGVISCGGQQETAEKTVPEAPSAAPVVLYV